MTEIKKILTGMILVFSGYVVFLLLLGFIPAYYAAMIMFTWGEIFATISEGPYISRRIPSSHRGRINGIMTVISTLICGGFDLAVGGLYDYAGPVYSWGAVFCVLAVAAVMIVILIGFDKRKYPKLYEKQRTTNDEQ